MGLVHQVLGERLGAPTTSGELALRGQAGTRFLHRLSAASECEQTRSNGRPPARHGRELALSAGTSAAASRAANGRALVPSIDARWASRDARSTGSVTRCSPRALASSAPSASRRGSQADVGQPAGQVSPLSIGELRAVPHARRQLPRLRQTGRPWRVPRRGRSLPHPRHPHPRADSASRTASAVSRPANARRAAGSSSCISTSPPPSSRHSATRTRSSRRRMPCASSRSASWRWMRRVRSTGSCDRSTSP